MPSAVRAAGSSAPGEDSRGQALVARVCRRRLSPASLSLPGPWEVTASEGPEPPWLPASLPLRVVLCGDISDSRPRRQLPLQAPRVGAPLFSLSPSSGLASVRPVPGELAPRSPRTREPVRLLSLTPGPGPPQRLWVSRCFPAPDTQASQPRAPGVPGRVRAAATCRGWGDGQTGPLPDAWRLRPSHRLGDRLQGALRPGPGRPLQAGPETSRALHPPVAPGDAERPAEAPAPEEAPLCGFAEGAASLQPPRSGQQPLQALTRLCSAHCQAGAGPRLPGPLLRVGRDSRGRLGPDRAQGWGRLLPPGKRTSREAPSPTQPTCSLGPSQTGQGGQAAPPRWAASRGLRRASQRKKKHPLPSAQLITQTLFSTVTHSGAGPRPRTQRRAARGANKAA